MKRVFLAAVLSGIAVFLWGAISHMLLPVGMMGVGHTGPADAEILAVMDKNLDKPAVYMLPDYPEDRDLTQEEQDALMQRYSDGPTAFLVFQPSGMNPGYAMYFIWEILAGILGGFLAAFVVFKSGAEHFWCKVGTVTIMGLFAWVTISIPYWNWYRFPTSFTLGQGIDEVVGWFLGGLIIAWLVKPKQDHASGAV